MQRQHAETRRRSSLEADVDCGAALAPAKAEQSCPAVLHNFYMFHHGVLQRVVVHGMRLIRRPWKDCCFWYVADLPLLTCCTCSLLLSRRGVRGADKVLDDFKTGSKELVAVVDMTFSYAQQGNLITLLTTVRQGPGTLLPLLAFCTCSLMLNREADNVLDNCKTGHTELACRC